MYNDPIADLLGAWSSELNIYSVLLRVGLSLLFSAVIGCERSSKRHAAGLRTFIIISLASTGAMLLDLYLMAGHGVTLPVLSAVTLVAIALTSGNSILYTSKNQIKGLTTAAGLFACGILGLSVGAGYYTVSVVTFAALMLALSSFLFIEKYLKNRSNHFEIHLELNNKNALGDFIGTIRTLGLQIDDIESNPAYMNSGLSVYSVSLTIISPELKRYQEHREIIEALRSIEYVSYIEEMN